MFSVLTYGNTLLYCGKQHLIANGQLLAFQIIYLYDFAPFI